MANNFPNLKPSLNLDFVNGVFVDPRITFTRAGTRTYFGREMVKAEENLYAFSQGFNDSVWNKGALSVTTDTIAAPDGTLTAELLTPNTTNTTHNFTQSLSLTASTVSSVYVKTNGYTAVEIFNGAQTIGVRFSGIGTTNTVTNIGGAVGTIVDSGNGWYRLVTVFPSAVNPFYFINSRATYAGDGVSGIYVWGAQLEQRSFATAYTATTTQPITRYQRKLLTAAANEWPREFDPVTGECLGRSVWESRTNLLTYSEQFDNAAFPKTNVTVSADQLISPTGALVMDKVVESTAAGRHVITLPTVSFTSGTTYTVSFTAKKGERNLIQFSVPAGITSNYANIDLNLGQQVAGTASFARITDTGNGNLRISFTFTAGTTATVEGGAVDIITSSSVGRGASSYTGDGFSGVFIWGAQLEAGAFATPYIPTVASQVTRLADNAAMTGANFSSWYRQDEGTLVCEYITGPGRNDASVFAIDDGTTGNRINLVTDISAGSDGSTFIVSSGGVNQVSTANGTPGLNEEGAFAGAYKVNDFASSRDGGTVQTDAAGVIPVVTKASIGSTGLPNGILNGTIKRIAYYPARLTNAQLQALTR